MECIIKYPTIDEKGSYHTDRTFESRSVCLQLKECQDSGNNMRPANHNILSKIRTSEPFPYYPHLYTSYYNVIFSSILTIR